MTTKEKRLAKTGDGVPDWSRCELFIKGVCEKQIRPLFEEFLREHQGINGTCDFVKWPSPPRIKLKLLCGQKALTASTVFLNKEIDLIISLLRRLTSPELRKNLKFEQTSFGPFCLMFEISARSYFMFMDRPLELDIFGRFGGNASPPDFSLLFSSRNYPWEQTLFPSKGNQQLLDLGPFVCGNTMLRLRERVPNVIFSNLDPDEIDDIPFEWPSTSEKLWQQLDLPNLHDVLDRAKPSSKPLSFFGKLQKLIKQFLQWFISRF